MCQANWKLDGNTFYCRDFSTNFLTRLPRESVVYISFGQVVAAGSDCSKAVCTKC